MFFSSKKDFPSLSVWPRREQGISCSHRQSRKRMGNTLLMVQRINIFCLLKKQKIETYFISPASRESFFKGLAIKIVASVSWHTTPMSLWQSSELQLQRCSQKCCFGFCVFGFEGLLLVYIAHPWRFATIVLVFVSKILVFEKESSL